MLKRLEAQGYRLGSWKRTLTSSWDNCMKYNGEGHSVLPAAVRLRDQGGVVLRQARRRRTARLRTQASGMHLPERAARPSAAFLLGRG